MDDTVRDTLRRYLPETEPPMRLQLHDVIRHGRRRRRIRVLTPAGAATMAVLLIGSVFAAAARPPPAEYPPAPPTWLGTPAVSTSGTSVSPNPVVPTVPGVPTEGRPTASTQSSGNPAPATPGTSPPSTTAPAPAGPLYEFRAPVGHRADSAAQAMTDFTVKRLPAHRVTLFHGTISDATDGGDRYAIGGHMLWQEGVTYGYLFWMHRTEGYFPVTDYGLPVEPCADPARPAPGETCVTRPRTEDAGVDVLFDVNRGYRLRGVVEHRKDPNGGADIEVTLGFYLPGPGGDWPQFPNLAGQRPLPDIPYTAEQLRQSLHS